MSAYNANNMPPQIHSSANGQPSGPWMPIGNMNNMAPQQQFNAHPSGPLIMTMANWNNSNNLGAQQQQFDGQPFQPTTPMVNPSNMALRQELQRQFPQHTMPIANSNNIANQQKQFHHQQHLQQQHLRQQQLQQSQLQQQQLHGQSLPMANRNNMPPQQQHQQFQGQSLQPVTPMAILNDRAPPSASNPRTFKFEELLSLDFLSRIRESKIALGKEPESWKKCGQYLVKCHGWSPSIQQMQIFHEKYLSNRYFYFDETIRTVPGFEELDHPKYGASRVLREVLPIDVEKGWDTARMFDKNGDRVKSEWAQKTDHIVAQTAAQLGIPWDPPSNGGHP
jgi:hypothetical protein